MLKMLKWCIFAPAAAANPRRHESIVSLSGGAIDHLHWRLFVFWVLFVLERISAADWMIPKQQQRLMYLQTLRTTLSVALPPTALGVFRPSHCGNHKELCNATWSSWYWNRSETQNAKCFIFKCIAIYSTCYTVQILLHWLEPEWANSTF